MEDHIFIPTVGKPGVCWQCGRWSFHAVHDPERPQTRLI